MKIYTKTGDKGTTSLIGGKRIAKNHIRIEAYGTVDELIAQTGVVRDHLENRSLQDDLVSVQDQLMICAAILATDNDSKTTKIPKLSEERIVWLEKRIDTMEAKLKPLNNFILPGGHPAVSFAHVARTICRRAERCIISLSVASEVPDTIIMYFNRLSDYFFVLARFISLEFKADEIHWEPRLDK